MPRDTGTRVGKGDKCQGVQVVLGGAGSSGTALHKGAFSRCNLPYVFVAGFPLVRINSS